MGRRVRALPCRPGRLHRLGKSPIAHQDQYGLLWHANTSRPNGWHDGVAVECVESLGGHRSHPQPGEHLHAGHLLGSLNGYPSGSTHWGLPFGSDRGHVMECRTNDQPCVQLGHLGKLGGMGRYRQHIWLCQHVHTHGGALCCTCTRNGAAMDSCKLTVPLGPGRHAYMGVCGKPHALGLLSSTYRAVLLECLECMVGNRRHAQPGEHLCTAAANRGLHGASDYDWLRHV